MDFIFHSLFKINDWKLRSTWVSLGILKRMFSDRAIRSFRLLFPNPVIGYALNKCCWPQPTSLLKQYHIKRKKTMEYFDKCVD